MFEIGKIMNAPQVLGYGSWKSPITSELIVSKTIGIGSIKVSGENIYWLEKRPQEKGRNVIIGYSEQAGINSITPEPLSVRSRVHEYGGGAYAVEKNTVYFSNYKDGRIYQQLVNKQPQPLTNKIKQRYADIIIDSARDRLICICEDHEQNDREAQNSIVTISLSTGKIDNLVSGNDFYSSPTLSPDGKQIAWLSWNHPNMPWDSTYLWLANLEDEGVGEPQLIAGGEKESICDMDLSVQIASYVPIPVTVVGIWELLT